MFGHLDAGCFTFAYRNIHSLFPNDFNACSPFQMHGFRLPKKASSLRCCFPSKSREQCIFSSLFYEADLFSPVVSLAPKNQIPFGVRIADASVSQVGTFNPILNEKLLSLHFLFTARFRAQLICFLPQGAKRGSRWLSGQISRP